MRPHPHNPSSVVDLTALSESQRRQQTESGALVVVNPEQPMQAHLQINYGSLGNNCTKGPCLRHTVSLHVVAKNPWVYIDHLKTLAGKRRFKKSGLVLVFKPQERGGFINRLGSLVKCHRVVLSAEEVLFVMAGAHDHPELFSTILFHESVEDDMVKGVCDRLHRGAFISPGCINVAVRIAVDMTMRVPNQDRWRVKRHVRRAHHVVAAYLVCCTNLSLQTEAPVVFRALLDTVQVPPHRKGVDDRSAYIGIITGIILAGLVRFCQDESDRGKRDQRRFQSGLTILSTALDFIPGVGPLLGSVVFEEPCLAQRATKYKSWDKLARKLVAMIKAEVQNVPPGQRHAFNTSEFNMHLEQTMNLLEYRSSPTSTAVTPERGTRAEVTQEEGTSKQGKSQLTVLLKPASSYGLKPISEVRTQIQEAVERHNMTLESLFLLDDRIPGGEQGQLSGLATQEEEQFDRPEGEEQWNMASFYYVDGPVEELESLAEELNQKNLVEAAYFKPPLSLPVFLCNKLCPYPPPQSPDTPDFTSHQRYVTKAPVGVDAEYAHTIRGGKGEGMSIVDIEKGWFNHEDLPEEIVTGKDDEDCQYFHHGTAVYGIISGVDNGKGITGIAPEAKLRRSPITGDPNTLPQAIKAAADGLERGDVILLEVQRHTPYQEEGGNFPVEFWPCDFCAIQHAIHKGIIVVEAAGNAEDDEGKKLDDLKYNTPPPGFPRTEGWRNPFHLGNPTSGAILVGAGSPPPGAHHSEPNLSRLAFSNFGDRVDCQGWGRGVTSTGYGGLQGGEDKARWYTDDFDGTSSAAAIVAGVVLCLQGIRRAAGKSMLTPRELRGLLRETGSPQVGGWERIGNRPNLEQLIYRAMNID